MSKPSLHLHRDMPMPGVYIYVSRDAESLLKRGDAAILIYGTNRERLRLLSTGS